MKITISHEITPSVDIKKNQSPQKVSATHFNTILENRLGRSADPGEKMQRTQNISQTSVSRLKRSEQTERGMLIKNIENLLDMLEEYGLKLKDRNSRIQDIHPLICAIETEKTRLTPQLHSLPGTDGLRDILTHALQVTTDELNYFEKGIYKGS